MVPVKALELTRLDDGRQALSVTFDNDPETSLVVFGDLYAQPFTPARDEAISWQLVFQARVAAGIGGYTWGRLTVQPPPPREPW